MQEKSKNKKGKVFHRVSKQFTIFSISFVVLFFLISFVSGFVVNDKNETINPISYPFSIIGRVVAPMDNPVTGKDVQVQEDNGNIITDAVDFVRGFFLSSYSDVQTQSEIEIIPQENIFQGDEIDDNDWPRDRKDNTKRSYVKYDLEPPLELNWVSEEINIEQTRLTRERLRSSEGILIFDVSGDPGIKVGIDAFSGKVIWEKQAQYACQNGLKSSRMPDLIYDGYYYMAHDDPYGLITSNLFTGKGRTVNFGFPMDCTYPSGVYQNKIYSLEATYHYATPVKIDDIDSKKNYYQYQVSYWVLGHGGGFYKNVSIFNQDFNSELTISYCVSKKNCHLVAHNSNNGETIWDLDGFYPDFAIDNEIIYTAKNDSYFYAINYSNGNVIWRIPFPNYFIQSELYNSYSIYPLINEKYVVYHEWFYNRTNTTYYINKDIFIALDKKTGNIIWHKEYVRNITKRPILDIIQSFITDKYLYSFMFDYYSEIPIVLALDANNGNIVQEMSISNITFSVYGNKQIYLAKRTSNATYAIYSYKGQNPVAFAGDDRNAKVGEALLFNASLSFTGNSKTIINYAWDFGDGGTGTGITATHSYSIPGKYIVNLTITDSSGKKDSDNLNVEIFNVKGNYVGNSKNSDGELIGIQDNVVLYYTNSNGNLVYRISNDKGENYGNEVVLFTNSSFLTLAQKDNNVFIIYYDNSIKKRKFAELNYLNGNLNAKTPIILNDAFTNIRLDNLLIDSNGRLYRTFVGTSGYTFVRMTYSNDNGITWSSPDAVTTALGDQYSNNGYKAFIWNNKPVVMIIGRIGTNFYYKSQDNWSKFQGLFPYFLGTDVIDAIITDDQKIHVVYEYGDSLKYTYKTNDTIGNWSSPIELGARKDYFPKLSTDGKKLFLYWNDFYRRVKQDYYANLLFMEFDPVSGLTNTKLIEYPNGINPKMIGVNEIGSLTKLPFVWFNDNDGLYKMYSRSMDKCINGICIYLTSPINNYVLRHPGVDFECSSESTNQIRDIALYTDSDGTFRQIYKVNGNHLNYNLNNIPIGKYKWNCYSCDINNNCNWNMNNYTFSYEPKQIITINFPVDQAIEQGTNVKLNFSVDYIDKINVSIYELEGYSNEIAYSFAVGSGIKNDVANLNKFVNSVNNESVNQTFIIGNIVNSKSSNFTVLNNVKLKLDNLTMPYSVTDGYWDPDGTNTTGVWPLVFPIVPYSFDKNGYHFIMMSFIVNNTWLENDLKKTKYPTFVFLYEDFAIGATSNHKDPVFKSIIEKYNETIIAVFNGHDSNKNNCSFINENHNCFTGHIGSSGTLEKGYRIVRIYKNGSITSDYIAYLTGVHSSNSDLGIIPVMIKEYNNVNPGNFIYDWQNLISERDYQWQVVTADYRDGAESGVYRFNTGTSAICTRESDCNYLDNSCSYGFCNSQECIRSYNSSFAICRQSKGECDLQENCLGNDFLCPLDIFKPIGTICSPRGLCNSTGDCQTIACFNDTPCGEETKVGNKYCDIENRLWDVYQNYNVPACNNDGMFNSYCRNNTVKRLDKDCGENYYEDGPLYCYFVNPNQQQVVTNRTSHIIGCTYADCYLTNYSHMALITTCYAYNNETCRDGKCVNIIEGECSQNSDCGTNSYLGNGVCQNEDVYKNYTNHTCLSPGLNTSRCISNVSLKLFSDCGSDSCTGFGANYCKNGDVYKNKTCHDKGCLNGGCFDNVTINETLVQDCALGCMNGDCTTQCTPNLVNTTWSDWVNISGCVNGFVNQSRNKTQYDANRCGSIANQTFYEYRLEGCTSPGCSVDSDCTLGKYCFNNNCYSNEDINNDTLIDFIDLVSVAQYVITDNCNLQNNWCNRRDINHDSHADFIDMVSVAIKM